MENKLAPYECQFSIEERKKIIAHTIRELRETYGYAQKEVAAFLKLKTTTYNTYENGRTEPPAEIIVRLSYLYDIPIDTLMQKDRLSRTALDVKKQIEEYKRQIAELDKEFTEEGELSPQIAQFRDALLTVASNLETILEKDSVKESINSDLE